MGIVLICWCLQLQEIFFSVGPEGENVYILAKMPQLSGLKTIYNLCSRYWLFFPQKTLDCYHRSWYLSCIFSLTLFFRFQFLPLFGGRLVPCAKIQIFVVLVVYLCMGVYCLFGSICFQFHLELWFSSFTDQETTHLDSVKPETLIAFIKTFSYISSSMSDNGCNILWKASSIDNMVNFCMSLHLMRLDSNTSCCDDL